MDGPHVHHPVVLACDMDERDERPEQIRPSVRLMEFRALFPTTGISHFIKCEIRGSSLAAKIGEIIKTQISHFIKCEIRVSSLAAKIGEIIKTQISHFIKSEMVSVEVQEKHANSEDTNLTFYKM